MGQENQCCSAQRVIDQEKDSELDTESNISVSRIEQIDRPVNDEEHFSDDGIISQETNFRSYDLESNISNRNNNARKYDINKIILIQSYYRMHWYREIFLDNCAQNKKVAEKELRKYITSKDLIKSHKGESLHNYFKKTYPKAVYKFKSPSYLKYNCFTINELIQYYPNEYYIGSWNIKKQYEGYGQLYINDNNGKLQNKFEGIFIKGKLEHFGYGIYPERENVYIGNWKNNLSDGKGQEVYLGNNKEVPYLYNGKYLNGSKIYGSLFYRDGSYYEGGFNHFGKFNGKGTYFWAKTKIKYEGEWFNDKMNGQGKMLYTDGSIYEGGFVNNIKHGFGTYIWKTKEGQGKMYYVGEFKNDIMDGKGKLYSGGKILEGIWKNGEYTK